MFNYVKFVLFIVLLTLAGLAAAQAPKRVALVIGNAAYVGEKPLRNPGNDAQDMAAMLRRSGFAVQQHVNLPRSAMFHAVRDFLKKAERADLAMVFYSGHGMQAAGETFFIPVDAKIESQQDVRSEGLRLGELMDDLEGAGIRHTVIVVDACRDNPFAQGTRSGTRGLARPKEMGGAFLVAYATADGRTAGDGDGRNGVYTTQLLRQLELGGASRNLRDLLEDTQLAVESATENAQRPKIYGDTARFRNVFLQASGGAGALPAHPAVAQPAQGGRPAIALGTFDGDAEIAATVAEVVTGDLRRGGAVDVRGVSESIFTERQLLNPATWAAMGASHVVGGSARKQADGKIQVLFRLWAVGGEGRGKDLGGQSYVVTPQDLRLVGHHIADFLQEKMTGKAGDFASRIARVESLPEGRYGLIVTDSDGADPQQALNSPRRIGLPIWLPVQDGRVVYVSLESGQPQVFAHTLASGARRVLPSSDSLVAACSSEITQMRDGAIDGNTWLHDGWARGTAGGACAAALRDALRNSG